MEKTPNHAEERKRFTFPVKLACQAWPSSWVAGLKDVRKRDGRASNKKLTLVDVGKHTTLGNGNVSKKLVQLLVVADGELKMTGDDTRLLVVAGSITSQLEDFGSQVLKDSSEVDRSTSTDTLSIVALAKKTVDTTDRESETSLGGTTAKESGLASKRAGQAAMEGAHWMTRGDADVPEERLTIEQSSWSQRPCRQTCRQSF